jgi:hypothetical protein
MKSLLLLVVTTLGVTACADEVCGGVGLERFPPADTTLTVGQSFVLRFEEGGTCDPDHVTDADFHPVVLAWTTPDTLVVRIDSATQRVTGLRVGDAVITAPERGIVVNVHVRE